MSSSKAEVGALGIRKDAKNMFTPGRSMWAKTKFKLRAINEFSGPGDQLKSSLTEDDDTSELGESAASFNSDGVSASSSTSSAPPRPVVLQRNMSNSGFAQSRSNLFDPSSVVSTGADTMYGGKQQDFGRSSQKSKNLNKSSNPVALKRSMSTGQFGASRANLFDAGTVVPSAAEQHGHIESACGNHAQQTSEGKQQRKSPPVALKRALSQSAFGASRANLFDPNTVMPSASEQMGIAPAAQGGSAGVKRPRTGDVPVVMQRHMSQSRFGASRANIFDASSIVPSAVDQMGFSDIEAGSPTQAPSTSARGPVSLKKTMSQSAFGASRANLFDAQSVIPSAAEQMGVVTTATHALPPPRGNANASTLASADSKLSAASSVSKPIKLQKTMSQSAFGASRANLFDAQSVIPSAAEQMGVVPSTTHALPPSRNDKNAAALASADSKLSATSSISKPAKLQKTMSQSAFGASRANLFDARSVIPSAAEQMGVVPSATHALPPPRNDRNAAALASADSKLSATSSVSKPIKLQKTMSQSAFGASRANLFDAQSVIPSAADQMGVIASNIIAVPPKSSASSKQLPESQSGPAVPSSLQDSLGQASISATTSVGSRPVSFRREMSKSAFGMSRSNLFDPLSAVANASEQMGLASPNEVVARRAANAKKSTPPPMAVSRAQSVSVFLALGSDEPEHDQLAHTFAAEGVSSSPVLAQESAGYDDDPFGPRPDFGRQESVSQMLLDFSPAKKDPRGSIKVIAGSFEDDDDPIASVSAPGFGRQESVSQMLLDYSPGKSKPASHHQVVAGDFEDDDDDPMASMSAPGFGRQESVSQMLLDFSPGKSKPASHQQVIAGSFEDDDDDPMASVSAPGFGRQESVSQMLLDFSPGKSKPASHQQVIAGSFEDDDDDPMASVSAPGFGRQESVSQMLLDFSPAKSKHASHQQVVAASFDDDDDPMTSPSAPGFGRQESVSQMLLDFQPKKSAAVTQASEEVVAGSFSDSEPESDDDDPYASLSMVPGYKRQESVSHMLLKRELPAAQQSEQSKEPRGNCKNCDPEAQSTGEAASENTVGTEQRDRSASEESAANALRQTAEQGPRQGPMLDISTQVSLGSLGKDEQISRPMCQDGWSQTSHSRLAVKSVKSTSTKKEVASKPPREAGPADGAKKTSATRPAETVLLTVRCDDTPHAEVQTLPSITGTSVRSPTSPREIVFGAAADIAHSFESRMAMLKVDDAVRARNDRFIPAVLRRQLPHAPRRPEPPAPGMVCRSGASPRTLRIRAKPQG